ncbi:MAG: ATP phosphoribosyltransferase [Fibrobacterales bacterium]|nr:ATP phosphoribosyltransferase [Fibrobacterales bacterium]
MIRMALPNKGQLFEPTIELLKSCGYVARKDGRSLCCLDEANGVEFYFLRPSDIPRYVGKGIIDAGITGLDFNAEAQGEGIPVLDLPYGASRLCAAIPAGADESWDAIPKLRIATSFPNIVKKFFGRDDLKLVVLEGAVEISVALGVADAVVDIVETGTTLRMAGLKILGEPLFRSNAALFANPAKKDDPAIARLVRRIEGRMVAMKYMMVEYDAPESVLEAACRLTPGIASPTVSPLHKKGWFSVKSMIEKKGSNRTLDELADLGCKGVVLTAIETARI